MTDTAALYEKIEGLRKKLYRLIEENSHNVNDGTIIEVSQELDQLILTYQKQNYL